MQREHDVERSAVEELALRDVGVADPNIHWREIFNKYDVDQNGRISLRELRTLIDSGGCGTDIPRHVVKAILKKADLDNSGHLDLEEFIIMVHQTENQNYFSHLTQKYVKFVVPSRRGVQYVDATDGQYEEQYTCWPPAICMIIVSVIEFILFMIDAFVDHPKGTGPIATKLIYNPYKRFEAWRFLTYMFVHIGSVHLVVNLIVQLLLGIPLEMVHKWWRVLLIYLAGVVAGSLGTSITDPTVFLAGASGGVYALITAHLATLFINWKEIEYAAIQLIVFLCIVGTDVGTAVYNRYFLDLEENIGYVAHLAGAIAGLLVGIGVLRNLEVQSWEKYLWWCAVVTYFFIMAVAVLLNIFWTDHFPYRPDYK
ncbi:rhomboid-4 isoform X2 [Arctopsyche grandis]|uniref:rhomboid-4 isoform X2 n=1 Tax=Arctopsyche grandis TaxID=121162 RepID=UPI00406D64CE